MPELSRHSALELVQMDFFQQKLDFSQHILSTLYLGRHRPKSALDFSRHIDIAQDFSRRKYSDTILGVMRRKYLSELVKVEKVKVDPNIVQKYS